MKSRKYQNAGLVESDLTEEHAEQAKLLEADIAELKKKYVAPTRIRAKKGAEDELNEGLQK